MERSAENTTNYVYRIMLIIAIAFVFFVRSERTSDHSSRNIINVTVELKDNSQAIPSFVSELPGIRQLSIVEGFKINPEFLSFSEILFNLNVTEKLHQCFVAYSKTKPLFLTSMQYQMLPRRPDPEASLHS